MIDEDLSTLRKDYQRLIVLSSRKRRLTVSEDKYCTCGERKDKSAKQCRVCWFSSKYPITIQRAK